MQVFLVIKISHIVLKQNERICIQLLRIFLSLDKLLVIITKLS